MKIKYTILICLAMFAFSGCSSLDITNTTSYDANLVWSDENLASAYVTNLYPTVFGNWSNTADNTSEQVNGISLGSNSVTITGSGFKSWRYESIRAINEGIKYMSESPFDEDFKLAMTSQMLFMRAYEYFKMLVYHGGVPYITKPQDKDVDDLQVKRNTTAECFEFIIKDITDAMAGLPEHIDGSSSDYGRIDQCFAKAFEAKVLLYMASPQFNPNHPYDNAYISQAYNAAKEAYEFCKSHGHQLTPSYDDIWLVEKGPEVIFAVINTYPNKTAEWDNGTRPGSESRSSTWASPTWEVVKEFPMLDGKAWNDPTGKYFTSADENVFVQRYWVNRDPRFASSIVYNGAIYELSGKTGRRQYTSLGIAVSDDSFGYNPNAGVTATHNDTYTGMFIRKIQKTSLTQAEVLLYYDVDFQVMRFAEVMMIYAEAAVETNNLDAALEMLKGIRKRAGIEPGTDGRYGITATTKEEFRKAILDERAVEFCFEGHRFLDLRRTRNLDKLNGLTKHGVEAIPYDNDKKEDMNITKAYELSRTYQIYPEDFRSVIHQVPQVGETTMITKDSYYFFPIQQSHIDSNPKIEQNKDWGGTFNPALD